MIKGLCVVCGKEFPLKHKTKHGSSKVVKGICATCSVEKQKAAMEKEAKVE